ncbi:ATP-binding protein [Halarcobacter sp.]|uniref:ATP-binding protein n=1 Tax=Halarcobacter sp. TaxID=2321133 RepID=UPI002AAB481C|nr:ATP-binding protein [Halarcobacter sp.]
MKFRVSSALKNIIGKDLIVDDYIAIFELVKNSFDAHASEVEIIFKNNSIIIKDNGKGMNKNDLINKWLFVAYSAKELGIEDDDISEDFNDYRHSIDINKSYAGAKGIGRFSCDRLGKKLTLITKKIGNNISHQLDIDWDMFEQDPEEEFMNIPVDYKECEESKLREYSDFKHGTILVISFLRDYWEREHKLELKKSLGKLINPFESFPSFRINVIDSMEVSSDNNEKYEREKVNGYVKNSILEILNFKTTNIEVTIENNTIKTKLIDRGELIYYIEEDNKYSYLNGICYRLFYLNRIAKTNFTRQMGIRPFDFGSIFLYNNGFRVYPFGDVGDDSLRIDRRHAQAYARTLGLRDLLGSIEILHKSQLFKETSSRDGGLIKNEATEQLFEAFYQNVLMRLEKYIVSIQWAYKDDYRLEGDKDQEDLSLLDTLTSKQKIIDLIFKLVDNQDTKLIDYNKNFLNIVNEKMAQHSPEILKNLEQLAIKTEDDQLINEINEANKKVKTLQKSLINAEEQVRKAYESQVEAEKRAEDAEFKVKEVEQVKVQKEKQILFLQSERTLSEVDLMNLQHHIGVNADLINGSIISFKREMDSRDTITKEEVLSFIDEISIANQKIIAIKNYATKADFLTNSETIKKDLIAFIQQYIVNIYKVISTNKIIVHVEETTNEFITKFKPMEMTIIIDNILNNARKAKATHLEIKFDVFDNNLAILFQDNGKGLDSTIKNIEEVFERGFTKTRGSGLGLYHIKQIVESMNGLVSIKNNDNSKGISLIIRLNK